MNPSIWELETFYRKRDVIIIGAGFTGLWSAISIKEKFPEKSVLVVERSSVPIGASTRNAGFACFGSFTEIIADSEKMGWEKTLDLVKMRFDGLKKIQEYFKPDGIDFELCGGFEIINDDKPLQNIDEVNDKLKSITNLNKTYFLNQEKIAEFGLGNSKYLIENAMEGCLHSGKLLQKLLEKSQNLGIESLFGTEVLKIAEHENSVKKKKKSFEIKEAVNEALVILRKVIEMENINIKIDVPIKYKVLGVSNELSQVIINLIQNSKDAFKINDIKNKKITITLKEEHILDKKYSLLEISDNAGGISKENADKIFEPYFTTKHKSQGTGLGLFMSKMIIEKSLDGELIHENIKNGSLFTIKLVL